ncbi:MAG: glucose-1-phosphate thymidylyltransferase [Candidatus Iainarchaeum archaeon]|uniref:Glucose-1-phosphate thymidylyltransferase n=1 Tax=Candidatus Iainarchaeum sp. TaxID=3101447 RepID=A0A497JL76_9ARCH|nr:MAG: glucose-1-phosphate thymidylyltransferase [Candidatus Diapherotrites archaeon]
MKVKQAVIMAAGLGKRLRPLTLTRPKVLLKAGNKSIIEHNLEQLEGLIKEVIIVVGYKRDMVEEAVKNLDTNLNIKFLVQQEQKGTADALKICETMLDEMFLVMNGDDFYAKEDIKSLLALKSPGILVKEVEQPQNFGIVNTEKGLVREIEEKPSEPKSNLANTGCYVLPKEVFSFEISESSRKELEIVEYINKLCKKEDVSVAEVKEYWFPIVYPWSLLKANEYFVNNIEDSVIKGEIEKNVTIKGNIILEEGAVIKSGTYIEGNAIIGKNSAIGPNALLRKRGGVSIGDNCKIGFSCEIINTIVMDNSKIPHLSYVGDSIIGSNCNFGAGSIVANLRHDRQNIKVEINGKLVDTGLRKFGAIVADNCKLGIKTVIYPGRVLWPNTTTLPGEIISKNKYQ